MNTAILLFILIVIAIAIFSFGLIIGSRSMCKRLADATAKAITESPLSVEQQIELLEKIKEYAKKYEWFLKMCNNLGKNVGKSLNKV